MARRRAVGYSQERLAEALGVERSTVARWERGETEPQPWCRPKIAKVLRVSLEQLGELLTASEPGDPWSRSALSMAGINGQMVTPDDEDRLNSAVTSPRKIDTAVVDSLAAVLAAQRRLEDAVGSAALVKPVRAQLAVIGSLVSQARGRIRPELVHVGGQWAQYAGWLHTSTGRRVEGDAWLNRALQWAVEAGEVNLVAEVLSFQGHAAWISGDIGAMIGLSRAARRDRSAYAGQLAISAAQEAQGHAMTGGSGVDSLLDEADSLAAAAREHPDEAPPWLYYHSPGFFVLQRGLAYRYLAADPGYRDKAIRALAAGHAGLPADEQSSEWGAEYLFHLASVHARGGEVEQGCAVAMRVAGIGRQTGSPRLAAMLGRLHSRLTASWPREACVVALGEALR